jgi:hypothetical protein
MSIIYSDDFSSYTPGQDPFDGWTDLGPGKGQIVAFNTYGTGNLYGQTGQGYNIASGPILYGGLGTTAMIPNATQVAVILGTNDFPPVMSIGITTDTTDGLIIASLIVQDDYTLGLQVNSQPFVNTPKVFANSTTQLYWPNVWQMYQVSWGLSSVPVITGTGTTTHTTEFIAVTASVWLEGTLVFNNAFGTSGISIGTGSDVGAAQMNEYFFGVNVGAEGHGFLSEIWATDSFLSTATFPFAGTNPGGSARMEKGIVEWAGRAGLQANARMTQGVVEIPRRPATRNVRMTQGVVEIIKRGGAAQGWVVYEV